jgi:hypothetical protein
MFNFEAAIAQADKDAKSTALEAIILAPSGGGKSSLAGTFGVKTLYCYGSGENHGIKAAKKQGGDLVVGVCYDMHASPDEALGNLQSILNDSDKLVKMGIKAIVIDGATELEDLVRGSMAWKKACLTAKGTHNTYEEQKATLSCIRPLITALKELQRKHGMHFALTCTLDVKDLGAFGEITDASPRLKGFAVAESLVQQFSDVIVVGRMVKGTDIKHKIQFMTELTKTSKEENGTVKRTINFSPRISGFNLSELPPILDADLSKLVEMKAAKFGA